MGLFVLLLLLPFVSGVHNGTFSFTFLAKFRLLHPSIVSLELVTLMSFKFFFQGCLTALFRLETFALVHSSSH